jgi:hypothetical protein
MRKRGKRREIYLTEEDYRRGRETGGQDMRRHSRGNRHTEIDGTAA